MEILNIYWEAGLDLSLAVEQESEQAQGKPETSRGVYAPKSIISGAGICPSMGWKEAGSEVHGGAGAVSLQSNSSVDAAE